MLDDKGLRVEMEGGGASCRLLEYSGVSGKGLGYGGLPDYVENKKTGP